MQRDLLKDKQESRERHQRLISTLGARGLLAPEIEGVRECIAVECDPFPLVGPNTPIDGGAYMDIGGNTAIIIDREHDPYLQKLLKQFAPAYKRIASDSMRQEGLVGLASAISRLVPYNNDAVTELYQRDRHAQHIVPRPLGDFIRLSIGICSQQALLTAAAIEYAKQTNQLPEECTVSIERSYDHDANEYHLSTILYIEGEAWLVDPTRARAKRAIKLDPTG